MTPRWSASAYRGFHPFHNPETGERYGSFEIFWRDDDGAADSPRIEEGWYWWPCFPGCLPDSLDAYGPFPTSNAAYMDAQELHRHLPEDFLGSHTTLPRTTPSHPRGF